MNFVDPNQFIITRKRKKYKFALFANSPICFEFDEWMVRTVDVIEVGAGDGMFLAQIAQLHPDKVFAAIDVKGDRLQRGARYAEEHGIDNIYFIRARADQIGDLFEEGSLESIWLTFSDPFPRKRSAGRRLTHARFLQQYAQLLRANNGALYIKHDNSDFFQWSLEQLVQQKWCIEELSFDLHDSHLCDEYRLLTSYEKRWLDEGRITKFAKACPNYGIVKS